MVCETGEREEEAPQKFLEEMLGGMREAAFRNTVFVAQAGARTDEGLAEELRSFMVNYENSLDEHVDVTRALDSLRKRKKEFEQKKKREEELLDARIQKCQTEAEYIRREIGRLKQQVRPGIERREEEPEAPGISGGGKAGNAAKALLAAGGMVSFAGAVFLDSISVRIFLVLSGMSSLAFFIWHGAF